MSAFTATRTKMRPIALPHFYIPLPRPCRRTLMIAALWLVGIGLPWLMILNLLPSTLFLGFLTIACLASGGTLSMIFRGEIV